MGTLTKTFVVLNLVFAIAFVAVSATVLSQRSNWKARHAGVEQNLQEAEEALKNQKLKYTADVGVLKEERDIKTREADTLTSDLADQKELVRLRDDTVR